MPGRLTAGKGTASRAAAEAAAFPARTEEESVDSINITVTGQLGGDPKQGTTRNGKAWASFSLAADIPSRGRGGEREYQTRWYTVWCYDLLAEHVAESLAKGDRVTVRADDVTCRAWIPDGPGRQARAQAELKAYEVSKYCSMTYHNYGPTALVMNLDMFNGLTPQQQKLLLDASRAAQERIRGLTESVDTAEKAKELLELKGMMVNTADVEAFRKVAQDKIWPQYQKEYSELWDEIVATKV